MPRSNEKTPVLSHRRLSMIRDWEETDLNCCGWPDLEAHAAHAAHAAAAARHGRGVVLGQLGDHGFGGDQQRGNRGGVLERGAHDLDRVDDAHLDHVAIFAGLGVVAEVVGGVVEHLADNHRAFVARVLGDLADRRLQGALDDADTGFLVGIDALGLEVGGGTQQRDAAARRRCLPRPRRGSH